MELFFFFVIVFSSFPLYSFRLYFPFFFLGGGGGGGFNVPRVELLPCGLIYNTGGCNIRLDENKWGRRSPSSSIHSQCFTLLTRMNSRKQIVKGNCKVLKSPEDPTACGFRYWRRRSQQFSNFVTIADLATAEEHLLRTSPSLPLPPPLPKKEKLIGCENVSAIIVLLYPSIEQEDGEYLAKDN